jgi:hypothetical protein
LDRARLKLPEICVIRWGTWISRSSVDQRREALRPRDHLGKEAEVSAHSLALAFARPVLPSNARKSSTNALLEPASDLGAALAEVDVAAASCAHLHGAGSRFHPLDFATRSLDAAALGGSSTT